MRQFNLRLASKVAAVIMALSFLLGNFSFLFPNSVVPVALFWVLNFPAGLIIFALCWLMNVGGPGDKESYVFAMTLTGIFSTISAMIWATITGFVFRKKAEPIKPPQTTTGSSAPSRV